jgi:hypothetical protein
MAATTNGQRILAQQIKLTWADGETNSTIGQAFMQVDSFQWRYNPDVVRYWPAGSAFQMRQPVNGFFEVTISGGQVDSGFSGAVSDQFNAIATGNKPPSITIERTAYVNASAANSSTGQTVFRQKFTSGVITSAGGDQADGNRPITETITLEFAQMDDGSIPGQEKVSG